MTEGKVLEDCVDVEAADGMYDWAEMDGVPTVGNTSGESVYALHIIGVDTIRLSKTVIPLSPPSSSHSFCIVTSQLVSRPTHIVRTMSNNTISPAPHSSASSDVTTTSYFDNRRVGEMRSQRDSVSTSSTEQSPSVDSSMGDRKSMDADAHGAWAVKKKVNSKDDKSSSGSSGRRKGRNGERWKPPVADSLSALRLQTNAEACWALVHSIDWSKTSLGPRADWAESIDPLLSIVFESDSQAALWVGDDVHLL